MQARAVRDLQQRADDAPCQSLQAVVRFRGRPTLSACGSRFDSEAYALGQPVALSLDKILYGVPQRGSVHLHHPAAGEAVQGYRLAGAGYLKEPAAASARADFDDIKPIEKPQKAGDGRAWRRMPAVAKFFQNVLDVHRGACASEHRETGLSKRAEQAARRENPAFETGEVADIGVTSGLDG